MTKSEKAAAAEAAINMAEQFNAVYKYFIASGDDWKTALMKAESLIAAMCKGVRDSDRQSAATTGFTALFNPKDFDK